MKNFIAFILLLAAQAMESQGGYLFVTFRNEGGPLAEQIYFATSQDGQNWTSLNGGRPVLVSNLGERGMRDPYILRSHDGSKFYLIATDLSIYFNGDWGRAQTAGSHSILVWESSDLVNWSQPRLVAVAPGDAGCTWAPEAIYDDITGDYLVYWASRTASDNYAKQRIWACRTTDFKTFGTPFIYIEKPVNVIDTDIIKDNGIYYRFSKDETYSAITMETSTQLTGTWTNVSGFTLASMQGYEGPECYQLSSGNWCLIADHYGAGTGYEPFVTSNLASGNFTAAPGFTFPFAFRHGAVLPVTTEEYNRLNSAVFPSTQVHLLFNEASGTTAADATGHAWNGTLVNGPLHTVGKGGNAVSLDGANDYVSLPSNVVSLLKDFTVSTWVKINSLATWSRIFDFGAGDSKYMLLTPKAGGTNTVRFAITTGGYGSEQVINGSAALPEGAWTHVAVTRQGNTGILYVNGVEVGRNTSMSLAPYNLGNTTQNWIGRSQFSSDPYLNGLIDDFRIYSEALPAASIQNLYNGTAGALSSSWSDSALGSPSLAGSAGTIDQDIVLTTSGTGIQGTADQGHFACRSLTGDGSLTARLVSLSANSSSATTAGIMFRDGLAADARCLFLGLNQNGGLTWQSRATSGGPTAATAIASSQPPAWLRVTRAGDAFTAYVSTDGVVWNQAGSPVSLPLPSTLKMGLAMSSGSNSALEAARFTNILGTDSTLTPPDGLSATAQSSAIALSWNAVSVATSYKVKRSYTSGGPYSTIASGVTGTTYTDTGLADGVTYYYVLSAVNGSGESDNSSEVSAMSGVAAADWFTELFASGDSNDTAFATYTFTPASNANGYKVFRAAASAFPTDPTGGTSLSLTDDSNATVTLTGGKQVSLYGTAYSTLYVGSNGYVTFGSADTAYTESLANHFNKPRVSALFDDLNPGAGGSVSWKQLSDRVAVTWQSITEYQGTNSNNFQIELFFDGKVRITLLSIAATDGLIGLSRGTGTPSGFAESNFSACPTLPAAPTGLVATGAYGEVSLSWGAVSGATGYRVKRSAGSGSGYVNIAIASGTSCTDTAVAGGTTYYYVVSTVNMVGESADSAEIAATPDSPLISAAETSAPAIVLGTDGLGDRIVTVTAASSVVGHTYQLQFTDDLVNGSWVAVGDPVSGTGDEIAFSIKLHPGTLQGFYRILIRR